MSGVLGINPQPLTLRELAWMFDAHVNQLWNHTASTMALSANIHRGKGKTAYSLSDFHPFQQKRVISEDGLRQFAKEVGAKFLDAENTGKAQ